MCVVSMVGDHFGDKWGTVIQPWIQPYPGPDGPAFQPAQTSISVIMVPREEFDALKREVEDMKALLARAKEYDERNNEPSCEREEKMDLLRRVAAAVGISLDDVIGPAKP